MEKIKTIIVDDHPLVRMGIKMELTSTDNICVVGEASSGLELLKLLESTTPDIVLLDILMPEMSGIEAAKILKEKHSDIKILIISAESTEETITALIGLGVEGFISKNAKPNEIAKAITSIINGDNYYGDEFSNLLYKINNAKLDENTIELTSRENEIVQLLCDGLSAKEIAAKLFITHRTVELHKENIFKKLGFRNSIELVKYAIKNKIVEI
ncbi:MAG: response regulator transcription factor [Bacteroidales bacterium]|nr:response regulator transcription factor [Bacteroidales bacterium]